MAIVYKKVLPLNIMLGIWDVKEQPDDLLSKLFLSQEDRKIYAGFLHNSRKLEWLCVRLLIKDLLGEEKKVTYDEHNKPYFEDSSHKISISHSKGMVAVILCKKNNVGIDIEKVTDRIERIVPKFMSNSELQAINRDNRIFHLYLHWNAKEALTKIYGKKDLIFDSQIIVKPFIPAEEGHFKAVIRTETIIENYEMNYFSLNDFVVVWAVQGSV